MAYKVEIGGGTKNLGPPWVNVDLCDTADIRWDLNQLPWPIADDTVDELYSSHCIEHVNDPCDFFREVARICKLNAHIEIRCPDLTSEMIMVAGHKSIVSINIFRHMSDIFPEVVFGKCTKRLKIVRIDPGADDYWFHLAKACPLFSEWTDEQILTWLPRTRHERDRPRGRGAVGW